MDQPANKPSGQPPSRLTWKQRTKIVLVWMAVSLLSLPLVNCATTSGTGTLVNCAGWKPETFDAKLDTKPTIQQIRQHNKFGKLQNCKQFQ